MDFSRYLRMVVKDINRRQSHKIMLKELRPFIGHRVFIIVLEENTFKFSIKKTKVVLNEIERQPSNYEINQYTLFFPFERNDLEQFILEGRSEDGLIPFRGPVNIHPGEREFRLLDTLLRFRICQGRTDAGRRCTNQGSVRVGGCSFCRRHSAIAERVLSESPGLFRQWVVDLPK